MRHYITLFRNPSNYNRHTLASSVKSRGTPGLVHVNHIICSSFWITGGGAFCWQVGGQTVAYPVSSPDWKNSTCRIDAELLLWFACRPRSTQCVSIVRYINEDVQTRDHSSGVGDASLSCILKFPLSFLARISGNLGQIKYHLFMALKHDEVKVRLETTAVV